MSRLYLVSRAVVWLLPATVAVAADPVEPVLEPDATVLAKLDALGGSSCCVLEGTT